jgi:uncharacterized RDD family membrane protein YckC
MKCPKCGYLCLDPVERCRHCGYRLSLNTPPPIPELPLRSSDAAAGQPLHDLDLIDRAASPPPASPHDVLGGGERTNGRGPGADAPDVPDLPLFAAPLGDDAPLITRAAPPRAPLAVRRATPEVPRLRTERTPVADVRLPGLETTEEIPARSGPARRAMPRDTPDVTPEASTELAGIGARIVAGSLDLLLLAAIDLLVIYFTLQIGGITWADRAILPRGPLIAFLVLQNLGYFVAFSVGGQTLGQVAMGIRVVGSDTHRPPTAGQAIVRTVVWLLLMVPAGLGLVTTLLDRERRGFHDRASQTRVIRV